MLFILLVPLLIFTQNVFAKNEIQNSLSHSNVTKSCQKDLQKFLTNLGKFKGNLWALQMLDASTKLQSGWLNMNFGQMGEFKQCIEAKSLTKKHVIRGKYCMGNIQLPTNVLKILLEKTDLSISLESLTQFTNILIQENEKVNTYLPMFALCLPSSCSTHDFNQIAGIIFKRFPFKITFVDLYCQTDEDVNPPLTRGAILSITFFAVIILIMLISSLYDYYNIKTKRDNKYRILVAFSVYTNLQKLFKTTKTTNAQMPCLNGIRFLSIVWVIVGHVHSGTFGGPLTNIKDGLNWSNNPWSMFIVNAPFSVDTFFVVGGCLLMYSFLQAQNRGVKFNVPMFYLHRYIRLTPALLAMILVNTFLLQYFGSGPRWPDFLSNFQGCCEKYWWSTLLYVQNYVNVIEFCIFQTWYLSVDMQLYLLSPFLLIPLQRKPKLAISTILALIISSMAYSFYLSWDRHMPAIFSNLNANSEAYMREYYFLTHTRASPWLIGLILGLIISNVKKEKLEKTNKLIITLVWIVCLCMLLFCIFAGHDTLREVEYDKWGNALHIAFMRPTWALCVSWIIYACVTNNGGPINWFLSLPLFQVLNRFSYSMYLIHVNVQLMLTYSMKAPIHFTMMDMCFSFWGVFMYSFLLAIFWVLAFESPMIMIEKVIFGKI